MGIFYDFSLEPGKELNRVKYEDQKLEPVISVIVPFYNDKNYITQSVNSVLNQTFPIFELLIIDDGSKDEESLEKLKEIEKIDSRIKVFHKENEGLAATRDYGASKACASSKYLMFLDSDDLMETTYLETAYWTLETNEDAAWTYTDSVGFENQQYTWNKWFSSEKMKKENDLVALACIRKKDFEEINGYEIREKAVNEDWNFWLKMIAKNKYPVHMSFYGMWYRRKKDGGELKKATENKKRSLEIINNTVKNITQEVRAIQYPRFNYNYEMIPEKLENILVPRKEKNGKINILMIIPWMIVGGADKFNLDLIKGLDRDKYTVTIVSTEPSQNVLRQQFEQYTEVYDLTSFLDKQYWTSFINYLIEKNNINLIFNTNSKFGYNILPYLKAKHNIPIIDYIHMEEWYFRKGGYARYSGSVSSVIDKTLTCNANTGRILNEYFGTPKDKLETVYIGVDPDKYNPSKYNEKDILQELQIDKDDKKIISYICRISEQKRPFLLLDIINKLKEKRQDFIFLVVGNGNLLNKMKNKAKSLGIEQYIKFLDYIEETQKVYKISDLTVNCSIKEGVALTSYESLAMGVPIVSSDVGGQKELINEKVGIIVPCKQKETEIYVTEYEETEIQSYVIAIDTVLNNLPKYSKECRNTILSGFTIDKMIEHMSNIFENVVNKETEEKNAYNIDVSKELITMSILADRTEYTWLCTEYEKAVYGVSYANEGMNYKKELLKERLWRIPMWRSLIKIYHKLK